MKVSDVPYMVGERVLLNVSPMKGVISFWKTCNLSPRFVGSFEVV